MLDHTYRLIICTCSSCNLSTEQSQLNNSTPCMSVVSRNFTGREVNSWRPEVLFDNTFVDKFWQLFMILILSQGWKSYLRIRPYFDGHCPGGYSNRNICTSNNLLWTEILPRNLNIFCWGTETADGFNKKQSLLAPDSSLPFGVSINSGVDPFCSSSHISAMDSLYPPPQSSTLSPENFT